MNYYQLMMNEVLFREATGRLVIDLPVLDLQQFSTDTPFLEEVFGKRSLFAQKVAALALSEIMQIEFENMDLQLWEARPHSPPSDLVELALPDWATTTLLSPGADWVVREAAFETSRWNGALIAVSAKVTLNTKSDNV